MLFLILNLYTFLMWMGLFAWYLSRKWKCDKFREIQATFQDQINEAARKHALEEAEEEEHVREELAKGKTEGVRKIERKAEARFGNMELPDMTPDAAAVTIRKLFQEGEDLLAKDDKEGALQSFLACILGFQKHRVPFRKLAQCINYISTLYFDMECYEEAVKYQQTERFIYEEALLNLTAKQEADRQKLESEEKSRSRSAKERNVDAEDGISIASASTHDSERFDLQENQHPLLRRADEFDRLSKVFGEEKNHALALDYAAKAVKLRQVARNEDSITDSSYLETFLRQYAELGRQQYQTTLDEYHRLSAQEASSSSSSSTAVPQFSYGEGGGEPSSVEAVDSAPSVADDKDGSQGARVAVAE